MSFTRLVGLLSLVLVLTLGAAAPAAALEECRLLRQPDIQGDLIVFVYAGDLWTVPRAGGIAARLTAHEGIEQFPKLSPDGRTIAFTAEYDGNRDAFTVAAVGGEPKRLTWHPGGDQVAEWYPDGRTILLRSTRASAPIRFDRFFRIPVEGGFEQMLPLPTGGYASLSADAKLIAYVNPSYDGRTWKRYRGGAAADIWVYDFEKNQSQEITDWDGPDEWPMFHGRTVYYCSDRNAKIANIWAYDLDQKTHRQVTTFSEYDVKWPSVGSDAIVFENGGYLYVMDLPSEKLTKLSVLVPDDKPAARVEYRNVSAWTGGMSLSPSAKRVVVEARGELFSVPAENGDVRNLTNTPGCARARPDVVAGRQVDRVPLRQVGRVPAPRDRCGRRRARSPGHARGGHLPLRPGVVTRLEEAPLLGQDAATLLGGRGERPRHRGRLQRVGRDPRLRLVGRLQVGVLLEAHRGRLLRHSSLRAGRRQADRGHRRVERRFHARVRSRREVPLLRLAAHVPAGDRRLRVGLPVQGHRQDLRDDPSGHHRLAGRSSERRGDGGSQVRGRRQGRRRGQGEGRQGAPRTRRRTRRRATKPRRSRSISTVSARGSRRFRSRPVATSGSTR